MMEIKLGQNVSELFGSNRRAGEVVYIVGNYYIVCFTVPNELGVVYGLYKVGADTQPLQIGATVDQVKGEIDGLITTDALEADLRALERVLRVYQATWADMCEDDGWNNEDRLKTLNKVVALEQLVTEYQDLVSTR